MKKWAEFAHEKKNRLSINPMYAEEIKNEIEKLNRKQRSGSNSIDNIDSIV